MAFDIEKDGFRQGGFTVVEMAEKRVRDTGMATRLFGHREVRFENAHNGFGHTLHHI